MPPKAAVQQAAALLPVFNGGSPGAPTALAAAAGAANPGPGGARRPASPGKHLLLAAQQEGVGGFLRAASAACLRAPLLLALTAALLLLGTGALAAWLLPQQPLPAMLQQVVHRGQQTGAWGGAGG
jgi:hypothetical protein